MSDLEAAPTAVLSGGGIRNTIAGAKPSWPFVPLTCSMENKTN